MAVMAALYPANCRMASLRRRRYKQACMHACELASAAAPVQAGVRHARGSCMRGPAPRPC
jgi:hypothetical protein